MPGDRDISSRGHLSGLRGDRQSTSTYWSPDAPLANDPSRQPYGKAGSMEPQKWHCERPPHFPRNGRGWGQTVSVSAQSRSVPTHRIHADENHIDPFRLNQIRFGPCRGFPLGAHPNRTACPTTAWCRPPQCSAAPPPESQTWPHTVDLLRPLSKCGPALTHPIAPDRAMVSTWTQRGPTEDNNSPSEVSIPGVSPMDEPMVTYWKAVSPSWFSAVVAPPCGTGHCGRSGGKSTPPV